MTLQTSFMALFSDRCRVQKKPVDWQGINQIGPSIPVRCPPPFRVSFGSHAASALPLINWKNLSGGGAAHLVQVFMATPGAIC